MSLFDNVDPEEFLLFKQNHRMTLEAPETLIEGTKIQYLHTFTRGEA